PLHAAVQYLNPNYKQINSKRMIFCTKCKCNHPDDQFTWDGIYHKTCRRCKENRDRRNKERMSPARIAEDMPGESQEHVSDITRIKINYLDVGDFVEHEIRDLTAGANIDRIADVAYKTHLLVQLDIAITQNKTAKEMADLVIAEVEGGDDYSWKKFGNAVGHFSYLYYQSKNAQDEDIITVDIYHEFLHPRPNLCIEMPNELREEINTHSHLTYSSKRIYFWKSIAGRKLFQRYDDHVESARKLLNEYDSHSFHLCLDIKDSEITAISFTTPLLNEIKNYSINITEIYLNVTYKTACGHYELYGVIAK
ncbi:7311_t:CDS:2, partial [Ambispora gerdemannii]